MVVSDDQADGLLSSPDRAAELAFYREDAGAAAAGRELEALDLRPVPAPEPIEVRARQNDVGVETVALAWVPHVVLADGRRERALP